MKYYQIFLGLQREINNKLPQLQLETIDQIYWLNKAVEIYVEKTYQEFEQTEGVIEDLKYLYKTFSAPSTIDTIDYEINSSTDYPNSYRIDVPNDIRVITNERCVINVNNVLSNQKVTPTTQDRVNMKLKDPFSQHNLKDGEAEPLRLIGSTYIIVITDGDYIIENYNIKYIKTPRKFVILDAIRQDEYEDFPQKSIIEIINIAANLILLNKNLIKQQE